MIEHPEQHIILVSGATGHQGGAVVKHLLQHGFHVRALTRDARQESAQKLQYIQVSWDNFKKKAGEESATMYRWFEEKGYKADITALRREYPALKHLKEFLREISF